MAPVKGQPRRSPRKKTSPKAVPKGQPSILQFFGAKSQKSAVPSSSTSTKDVSQSTTAGPSKGLSFGSPPAQPLIGKENVLGSSPEVVMGTPESRPATKKLTKVKSKLELGRTTVSGVGSNRATSSTDVVDKQAPSSNQPGCSSLKSALLAEESSETIKISPIPPSKTFSSPQRAQPSTSGTIFKRKPVPSPSPRKAVQLTNSVFELYRSPKSKKVKNDISPNSSPVATFTDDIEKALFESFAEDELFMRIKPARTLTFKPPEVPKAPERQAASPRKLPSSSEDLPNVKFRFEVTEVSDFGSSKCLVMRPVMPGRENEVVRCQIEGLWSRTEVEPGDVVNILHAEHAPNASEMKITNVRGLVIVNPDFLISGTAVMAGVFCRRKAVLAQSIRGSDPGSREMIMGILLHRIFQQTLKDGKIEERYLKDLVKAELEDPSTLAQLYAMNVSEEEISSELIQILPSIVDWLRRYYGSVLTGNFVTSGINVQAQKRNTPFAQWNGKITEIVDIEENIWSPRFGLKGKIDLSVKIRHEGIAADDVFPLELKTGKPSFSPEHTGQVILYSMMMEDRKKPKETHQFSASASPKAAPFGGLLVYLRDGSTSTVKAGDLERRDLVMLRNEMARSYDRKLKPCADVEDGFQLPALPKPIAHARACEKCPYLVACTAYQKIVEKLEWSEQHPMTILIPAAIGHLNDEHLSYYRKWLLLLSLEREDGMKQNSKDDCRVTGKDIWTLSGPEREKRGDCLSDMTLKAGAEVDYQGPRRYLHTFVKRVRQDGFSLRAAGLNVDDYVIVSSSDGVFLALSAGGVDRIGVEEIVVALDRDLTANFNGSSTTSYRIDRMSSVGDTASSICRGYLLQLMSDTPECADLRRIIINREVGQKSSKFSMSKCLETRDVIKALNERQQRAVLHVLMSHKYALVRGVPGSGKTRLVVALIRVLARRLGKSVLLVSYTHSAIDNVLGKLLKEHGDEFHAGNTIRLGNLARMHSDVLSIADGNVVKNARSVEELEEIYSARDVVATTCLSVAHPMFSRGRKFDVCIVDEAAQALQLAAIGPLFYADKFVLVGDPHQLPPVVVSEAASRLGMSESLFSRLDDPQVTVELSIQYRMNAEIMRLANKLTYGGRLSCADESVASATLPESLQEKFAEEENWVKQALDVSLLGSVKFLSTAASTKCSETRDVHGRIINPGEAESALRLVQTLISAGVSGEDIGIITPFRAQVNLFRRLLREPSKIEGLLQNELENVEVNTVDQYQGRDKSVIIFSCVRTSTDFGKRDILLDERRLNVAVTRAKHKLILIGHKSALTSYKPFHDLMQVLRPDQFVDLPQQSIAF